MTKRKTKQERFRQQLEKARHLQAIYSHYTREYQIAHKETGSEKIARGIARSTTALKYNLTPDRIGQIVGGPQRKGEWTKLQEKIAQATDPDWDTFKKRASVMKWLPREEFLQKVNEPLSTLALVALSYANAEVSRLEGELIRKTYAEMKMQESINHALKRQSELMQDLTRARILIKQLEQEVFDQKKRAEALEISTRRRIR